MTYQIELDDDQEKFVVWYLKEHPLRPEHTKDMYPGLIAKNFIDGMRKRMQAEGAYCPKCSDKEPENQQLGG